MQNNDDRRDRRAQDRELARVLRFVDGDGSRAGAETRLDRMERQLVDLMRLDGVVRVLSAHAEGHPLLDKQAASRVMQHVESAEAHGRMGRAIGLLVGRSVFDLALRVIELVLLGYVAAQIAAR